MVQKYVHVPAWKRAQEWLKENPDDVGEIYLSSWDLFQYSAGDVLICFRMAIFWLRSNDGKKKVEKSNWKRFFTNWISNDYKYKVERGEVQDKGRRLSHFTGASGAKRMPRI